MKPHGIKLIWIIGLVLVVSAAVFSRVLIPHHSSAAQPQLVSLASLQKRSDPYVLTTAFIADAKLANLANLANAATDTELTAERARGTKTDFSKYVWLHVTRDDNLIARDDID